ncbi:helix-turn-helix domain-containing protein [Candidatus Electronema sp. JM]|uniref:helix-turn-helix domain-containing protein n=1 Tax=Candidatus Electronema sp. JM TaxID=3401571 RepID=UPI003AA86F05
MKTFKEFLCERRKSRKLTLRRLGELTDISASYLSEIENGVKQPPTDESKLKKLASALECDFVELLKIAQIQRATGSMSNILSKLFGQDDDLAWSLCREAENNEDQLREHLKEMLNKIKENNR